MPVLEAMACGCAVVCRDCGGPNDFLKPGVSGIIVEQEAPAKMVEEIVKIIDDKSRRKQLADEAIKTAKMLSWSSAVTKMEMALEGIISGYGGKLMSIKFQICRSNCIHI
jgi:glycosyltransferase involved in cell wall biosynthesis